MGICPYFVLNYPYPQLLNLIEHSMIISIIGPLPYFMIGYYWSLIGLYLPYSFFVALIFFEKNIMM
jgi:hypothetical protein